MNCVYFGKNTERLGGDNDTHIYDCQILDRCVETGGNRRIVSCDECDKKLTLDDSKFKDEWVDPLLVYDRRKQTTDVLHNMLKDQSVFLLGGGPSANEFPLEQLNRRGVWSMGINNMAGHPRFRPQAMLCSDPPLKFTHSVWLDPGIMKFVPSPKMTGGRANLRKKEDGKFLKLDKKVTDCPNVWGFRRESFFTPDNNFFLGEGAPWGNHNAGVKKTGQPKTVCTMLLALRVLRHLGVKRIFLVGVDFHMTHKNEYSFPQAKDEGGSASNNNQFSVVNGWLCEMKEAGVFKQFGLDIYNCYEHSGLRAFPYLPFEEAVEVAKGIVEDKPDLVGWYEKKGGM